MFNLENYETVDERIHKFWERFPEGRIETELLEVVRAEGGAPIQYIVCASIFRNPTEQFPMATGYAEEIVGSTNVNRQAALENAETSAVGRCLANAGFSAKGNRPSQTEMAKVGNVQPGQDVRNFTEIPDFSSWEGAPVRGTDTIIKDPGAAPSEKQTMALVNKTVKVGINSDFHNQFWQFCLAGGKQNGANPITKGEASKLIGMDKEDFEGYGQAFFGSLMENEAPF